VSDYCSETTMIRKNIERIQEAIDDMEDIRDQRRAVRTIDHLKSRIAEIQTGRKASPFQTMSATTLKAVIDRAEQRWDQTVRIPIPDVELIAEERLHTPPLPGEPNCDRWANNFQWAG
jgi:hypothetical protein